MTHTKSAAKRMKQSIKRNLNNRVRKSRVHTSEGHLDDAIAAGDAVAAKKALEACFSVLDKAAKVGSIHGNKADRKKSRLALRVAKMEKKA